MKVGEQELASYTYADVTNHLTELDYGNGNEVKYSYDKKGRVTQQAYGEMAENPDTGLEEFVADQTVTYTYDNNGALARVKDSATGITTTKADIMIPTCAASSTVTVSQLLAKASSATICLPIAGIILLTEQILLDSLGTKFGSLSNLWLLKSKRL